jgi:hypothetical protein
MKQDIGAGALVVGCLVVLLCGQAQAMDAADDGVRSLLGLRASTIPSLFVGPLTAEMQAAVATFFDDDARCNGHPDCVESIDTLVEARSLAGYLRLHWNDRLRRPISSQDLMRYRDMVVLPDSQVSSGITRLQAEERGDLLRRNTEEFRQSFWRSHLERNRAAILSGLRRFESERGTIPDGHTVMILGAGTCADIPLRQLAQRFEVILVDIDAPSMQRARDALPAELRQRVTLEVRDLSGGIVVRHSGAFEDIVTSSRTSSEAMERLAAHMESAVIPTPMLEGDHEVDALISSMLISQIPYYLLMQVIESLRDPSIGLEGQGWTPRFAAAVRTYVSHFDDAHAEALRDFCVRSGGFVYFSSDLCLKHSVLELGGLDDPVPELQGSGLPSLWHDGAAVTDLSVFLRSDPSIRILEESDPWIWEHLHPVLRDHWSPVRIESVCAPMRPDSCWTAGPRRFKKGRRFIVDAVSFTSAQDLRGLP